MDFHFSSPNGFASSEIYYKRDDFDFVILNIPFFWMNMFPVLHLTELTFLNLFDLLECLVT